MKTCSTHSIHEFMLQSPTPKSVRSVWTDAAKTVVLALASILSALLLVAPQASATVFSFSTGDPDGKIATLSRPPSPGNIQTETADDFILTDTTLINQATFTGLVPSGAALSSVSDVEIEMYHIVLVEKQVRSVPTRVFSPEDSEIGDATRDGLDGTLSFNATLLNSSFTAANSVVNGINASPNQFTGGEGPVSGQEVLISVSFNPPISLPAGHYFFRPEVLLSSGDFLLLSAPKPIVAPGTPFANPADDKQSWIRNDNLAPDWLRIGTDITHQGPFNAAFTLSGETDADGDGVPDSADACPNTPAGAIVDANGCSVDQLAPCAGPASGGTWKNHGAYVSAFAQVAEQFVEQGLITEDQKDALVGVAAASNCGAKSK